jgi:hydrogenase maturation protease
VEVKGVKRIICVGNQFIREDSLGPRVYAQLSRESLPVDIELYDGGLSGLDLLPLVEGAKRVIFIDNLSNKKPGKIIHLTTLSSMIEASGEHYDHAAGLSYLLRVLPEVIDTQLPELHMLGLLGEATQTQVKEIATEALKLARENNVIAKT